MSSFINMQPVAAKSGVFPKPKRRTTLMEATSTATAMTEGGCGIPLYMQQTVSEEKAKLLLDRLTKKSKKREIHECGSS